MKLSINGRFLLQDVTGVQRVAIEFVRTLDDMLSKGSFPDLEVTIWTPQAGRLVTDLPLKSILLRRAGRFSGHAWEQVELPRLAGQSALLCLGNTAPALRLARRREPTFTMVHDLSYKYFPSAYSGTFRLYYNLVMPVVLARSTHVFTVSRSEENSLLRHYPRLLNADRLTAVQNGGGEAALAPTTIESTVPARLARQPMCLYVGSLTKRKNGEGLIRAAVALAESRGITFVFVGATGSNFEHVGMDVPEHIRDRIIFLGQVNEPERIDELYRQARVFVFPSFYEASPLPPVEAMSLGCPVVCSDIPSLRERCGDAAVYCDPSDWVTIVDQVSRVLFDEALWQDLQERGLMQASQFTWERQVDAVMEVLRRDS